MIFHFTGTLGVRYFSSLSLLNPLNVILIRHAESVFNAKCHKYTLNEIYSKQAQNQFHHDPTIMDCSITEEGRKNRREKQLIHLFEDKKTYDSAVFVSPMLRTLQTTKIILQTVGKDYKVMAIPQLSQVLSKICDFSSGINDKKEQFPDIDFKYIDKWMQENNLCLKSQNWQDPFLDKDLTKSLDPVSKAGKRYLKLLKMYFPKPLQSAQKCQKRSIEAFQKVCKICLQQNYKNAIIISHNRILKNIETYIMQQEAKDFDNLEIRKFKIFSSREYKEEA